MESIKLLINRKISFTGIIYLAVIFTTLRVIIEEILLEYPIRNIGFFQEHVRFYLENIFYFIILFLTLSFFISMMVKKNFSEVANIGIRLYPITILPPIIDRIIFGRMAGYEYAAAENFFYNVFTLGFAGNGAPHGISIEILIVLLIIAVYTFYIRRSIFKTISVWLGSAFIIALISTPEIFFGERADFFFIEFLPTYYYFPLLILSAFLFFRYNKEKLRATLSNLRPIRALVFILATFIGALIVNQGGINSLPYETFLAIIAVFFVWEFSVIINDIYDRDIDKLTNRNRPLPRKILNIEEYRFIAVVFAFFAISFSIIINFLVFLTVIICLALGIIYSAPPLRLRKNILGNFVIGTSLVLSFVIGLLTHNNESTLLLLLASKNIVFYTLLFIFGTIISLIKDIKDVEGDKENKIKNLFTIYGRKKGKIIVLLLILIIFNTPIIFAPFSSIFLLNFLLSILAFYLYYKYETIQGVYAIGIIIIFITLFSFYGNILVKPEINTLLNNKDFPHNYVLFTDRNNNIRGKIHEDNGWLLLETLLTEKNHSKNKNFEKPLEFFSDYRDGNGNYGWWPQNYIREGKYYFKKKPPLVLYYDIDDTVWGNRVFGDKIPESIIKSYVSNTKLPEQFEVVCSKIYCKREFIIRVWGSLEWHDEIDIITIANLISAIKNESIFTDNILRENKKLINYIIENYYYYNYFIYYEPKVTGDFLLLFYDKEYNNFLSEKARKILTRKIRDNYNELRNNYIASAWSGGKDELYGFKLIYINENIPNLMYEYTKTNFISE